MPVIVIAAMAIIAAAPMSILAGGVVTIIRKTHVVGLGLIYLLMAVALLAFALACSAMARHSGGTAGLHVYVARGFGPRVGRAVGLVALVSYNAMTICYFGVLGNEITAIVRGAGAGPPWWLLMLPLVLAMGLVGTRRLRTRAIVIVLILVVQIGGILLFDFTALNFPSPEGVTGAALDPVALLTGSAGATVGLALASYVGVESATIHASGLGVSAPQASRGLFLGVVGIGLIHVVSAVLAVVAIGAEEIVILPLEETGGATFVYLEKQLGAGPTGLFAIATLLGLFGATLVLHYTSTHYLRVMAEDGVLPSAIARRHPRTDVPTRASLLQTAITLVILLGFGLAGAEPLWTVFFAFSYLGATGVIAMIVVTSIAIAVYLLRGEEDDGFLGWEGPLIGAVVAALCFALVLLWGLLESPNRLNVPAGSPLVWGPPLALVVAFLTGLLWPSGSTRRTSPTPLPHPPHPPQTPQPSQPSQLTPVSPPPPRRPALSPTVSSHSTRYVGNARSHNPWDDSITERW